MGTGEHIIVCNGLGTRRRYVSGISGEAGISGAEELDDKLRFVGYCNGLWCLQLSDEETCKFVIANPTTSELRYLPPFGIENSSCGKSSCRSKKCTISFELKYESPMCALGFDSRNGDFKLLVHVNSAYYDLDQECKDLHASRHCMSMRLFIYSLQTNTWKERKELANSRDWSTTVATSFQSVCYWALDECVLSFDFCDEKFTQIPYPPDIWDKFFMDYVIIDLLGSVGAVTYLNFGGPRFFRFWVLDGDGDGETWKRKMEYDVFLSGLCKPLAFGVSCTWFLGRDDDMLVQYDYATKQTTTLSQFRDSYMELFPHVVNNLNIRLNGAAGGFRDMFKS